MAVSIFLNRVRHWGIAGGLSVLDQGTFSVANFILTIVLARWLDLVEFGQFAIGLAVIVFFMQIYTSFLLEPMGVIGPSKYAAHIHSYLHSQIRILFILFTPLGIVLAIMAWIGEKVAVVPFTSSVLVISFLGLPLTFFPLVMRRIYYILHKPAYALIGSITYFISIFLGLFIIKQMAILTSWAGMIVSLFAALLSGLVSLIYFSNSTSNLNSVNLYTILVETWNFGKWLIVSGLLFGLATQSQIYLTGILSSPEEAGTVRILQTLIQPLLLASSALSSLIVPSMAADYSYGNFVTIRKKMFLFMIVLGFGSVFYEIILSSYGMFLKDSLFGEKYVISSWLLLAWGTVPILLSLFWGGVMALQASQNPKSLLIISIFWGTVSLLSSVLFIPSYGVWGATISMVLGFFTGLITTWVLYWLKFGKYTP